jgi:glycosyltransferase involved in cell wall biosynthesis
MSNLKTSVALPVSVQVITLNEELNISQCLESIILNNPAEIVVVDGGSTDQTVAIARKLGAIVIECPNLGRGESRKIGYLRTNFPYVAMVDADDRIPFGWLANMQMELELGNYGALQSGIKVLNSDSFFGKGWDAYFKSSLRPSKDSIMVGHPAIYRTSDLKRTSGYIGHEGEDTQLSKHFQNLGIRQGISSLKCERIVPDSRRENFAKWRGYGRGYFEFIKIYPTRLLPIVYHVIFRIPVIRGIIGTRFSPSRVLFHFFMSLNISIGLLLSLIRNLTPERMVVDKKK